MSGRFTMSRGSRQGDPLSPYLVILYFEFLTRLLLREIDKGRIHGIKVSKKALIIFHLMHADNLLVMCNANKQEAVTMKRCFGKYCG